MTGGIFHFLAGRYPAGLVCLSFSPIISCSDRNCAGWMAPWFTVISVEMEERPTHRFQPGQGSASSIPSLSKIGSAEEITRRVAPQAWPSQACSASRRVRVVTRTVCPERCLKAETSFRPAANIDQRELVLSGCAEISRQTIWGQTLKPVLGIYSIHL